MCGMDDGLRPNARLLLVCVCAAAELSTEKIASELLSVMSLIAAGDRRDMRWI
jgi:hypothetical protein